MSTSPLSGFTLNGKAMNVNFVQPLDPSVVPVDATNVLPLNATGALVNTLDNISGAVQLYNDDSGITITDFPAAKKIRINLNSGAGEVTSISDGTHSLTGPVSTGIGLSCDTTLHNAGVTSVTDGTSNLIGPVTIGTGLAIAGTAPNQTLIATGTGLQTVANLEATLDTSTTKYPSGSAVCAALNYYQINNLETTLDTSTIKYPSGSAVSTALGSYLPLTGGKSVTGTTNFTNINVTGTINSLPTWYVPFSVAWQTTSTDLTNYGLYTYLPTALHGDATPPSVENFPIVKLAGYYSVTMTNDATPAYFHHFVITGNPKLTYYNIPTNNGTDNVNSATDTGQVPLLYTVPWTVINAAWAGSPLVAGASSFMPVSQTNAGASAPTQVSTVTVGLQSYFQPDNLSNPKGWTGGYTIDAILNVA